MGKKKPKIASLPNNKKIPKLETNPDSFLSTFPSWKFSLCDTEHIRWRIRFNELDENLMDKLKAFEKITWGELLKASGGKTSGTNHNFIKVADLVLEAQKRLKELKIVEDQIFSLRLNGESRLFGILSRGVFKLL